VICREEKSFILTSELTLRGFPSEHIKRLIDVLFKKEIHMWNGTHRICVIIKALRFYPSIPSTPQVNRHSLSPGEKQTLETFYLWACEVANAYAYLKGYARLQLQLREKTIMYLVIAIKFHEPTSIPTSTCYLCE